MTVTVEQVMKALPKYAKLDEDQVSEAIGLAEAHIYGINPDWEDHPQADNALLLASISMTLKLHFPQNTASFQSLDNEVTDILNSVWSSSNMVKNKNRYMVVAGTKREMWLKNRNRRARISVSKGGCCSRNDRQFPNW